jgi:curved DNA-binding protein CbpA
MAEHSDFRNYYRILGLTPTSSSEDIRREYRRLAKEQHPDRHPNDPAATAKFQVLNEAHATLSNPESRAGYDAACIAVETQAAPFSRLVQ